MRPDWERTLERWKSADLIDAATADRIRQFEEQTAGPSKLRWPTIVALVFGGFAGIRLFAHVGHGWHPLSLAPGPIH